MCGTHLFMCHNILFYFILIMQDTARTQEHKKLNTLLQNKVNIHTLNSNMTFEN